jgi:hypothetical protein
MTHDIKRRFGRRGRATWLAMAALAIGAPGCAAASGVSGVFVTAKANLVELIQIVQTPDGRLSGRVEDVSLAPNGNVEDKTMSFDGAADGRQIVLSIRLPFLGVARSATASLDGDMLHLWWQGGSEVLRRADTNQFETAVYALRSRSSQIKAELVRENAARDRETAVQSVLALGQRVSQNVDALAASTTSAAASLRRADEQYGDLASNAQRNRRVPFILSASNAQHVQSMHAGTDAQGYVIQINLVHSDVRSLAARMTLMVSDARSSITSMEAACHSPLTAANPGAEQQCARLSEETSREETLVTDLQKAFNLAKASYQDAIDQANAP